MPRAHHPHKTVIPAAAFVDEFGKIGASGIARKYGIRERQVYARRRAIERDMGAVLTAPSKGGHVQELDQHPAAINIGLRNGIVLIGSDGHFWPGVHSTAFRAFVQFCQKLNPSVVVMNGDAYDGARVSRWPDGSWINLSAKPTVLQELEATRNALDEIRKASPNARHIFPLGNHDARFEMRLVQQVPEYAEVHGTRLKDHIEGWEPCWAALINKDIVVKHRFKSGIHAPHNNTMWAGRTIATGHLHSLKVMPLSDYNGTRWGIDTGTLADPYGPQFYNYLEMNPVNWRSGFAVLTVKDGKLMWPEVVWANSKNTVQWRGEEIKV